MFIKTIDGSYININHIELFYIRQDYRTKAYCIGIAPIPDRYTHSETPMGLCLAKFDSEREAQSYLDDLISKIERGSIHLYLPTNSTTVLDCKPFEKEA